MCLKLSRMGRIPLFVKSVAMPFDLRYSRKIAHLVAPVSFTTAGSTETVFASKVSRLHYLSAKGFEFSVRLNLMRPKFTYAALRPMVD